MTESSRPENGRKNIFLSGITPLWPFKLVLSLVLLVVGFVALYRDAPGPQLQIVGVAMMVVGSSINLIHYRIIKRQAKKLGAPEKLVTAGGLFGMIRHPMYFGDLAMFTGLAVMGNIVSVILTTLFLFVLMGLTIQEDRMMAEKFPEDFTSWKSHSKRLIPFIW